LHQSTGLKAEGRKVQQFICGFIVALLAVVPVVALILHKKKLSQNQRNKNGHLLEELSKLTGELAHEIKNPLSTIKINLKLVSEELEEIHKGAEENSRYSKRNGQTRADTRRFPALC
jgi:nitrogen-specific signal transduction histidine kinase